MKGFAKLGVLFGILLLAGIVLAVQIDWPTYLRNSSHTAIAVGSSINSTSASQLVPSWAFTGLTDGMPYYSPIVYNSPQAGMVAIIGYDNTTTGNGTVFILNASSGALLGSYECSNSSGEAGILGAGAVSNDVLFIGCGNGGLYALNISNVASPVELWHYNFTNWIEVSPVVVNGVVYSASYAGVVVAINLSTNDNTSLWTFDAGPMNGFASSPAVSSGVLYIGNEVTGVLFALDASNGTQLWNYTVGAGIDSSPVVSNGVVYFTAGDNNTYALDASNGTQLWNYTTGADGWPFFSTPVVVNGIAYVGSTANKVYALDASTGASLWNYTTTGNVQFPLASANDVIVFGDDAGILYVANASNNAILKTFGLTDGLSAPIVSDGNIYVRKMAGGNLYVFSMSGGPGGNNVNVTLSNNSFNVKSNYLISFTTATTGNLSFVNITFLNDTNASMAVVGSGNGNVSVNGIEAHSRRVLLNVTNATSPGSNISAGTRITVNVSNVTNPSTGLPNGYNLTVETLDANKQVLDAAATSQQFYFGGGGGPGGVQLNSPLGASEQNNTNVTFNYTWGGFLNLSGCGLWTNESGAWQQRASNASTVFFGPPSYIYHNVSASSLPATVLWNVNCSNDTDSVTAPSNASITLVSGSPSYCGGAYTGGNFGVSTVVTCQNEVVPVSGNVTILAGGNLTLNNAVFSFNMTAMISNQVNVTSGGAMYVRNNSRLTSNDTNLFYFVVVNSSNFLIENSTIEYAGNETGNCPGPGCGVWVYDSVNCGGAEMVRNSVFSNEYQFATNGRNCNFTGNHFTNSRDAAFVTWMGSSGNYVFNNTFLNDSLAFGVLGNNNVFRQNNITSIADIGPNVIITGPGSAGNVFDSNRIHCNGSMGIGALEPGPGFGFPGANTLTNNTITNCAWGIWIDNSSYWNITYNNVTNNSVGVILYTNSTGHNMSYNNIYGNSPYNFYNDQPYAVTAQDNWWGSAACNSVNATIYNNSNVSLGAVSFSPLLNSSYPGGSPVACALPSTASNLSIWANSTPNYPPTAGQDLVTFYANYSVLENGSPINDSFANCTFSLPEFAFENPFGFNGTSGLWEFPANTIDQNATYHYYVTCNGTPFDNQTRDANLTVLYSPASPCKIAVNSSYYLNNSVAFNQTQCVYRIIASNVVFDCKGYNITSEFQVGNPIYATDVQNITIRNCSFLNFSSPVQLERVSNATFISNNFTVSGLFAGNSTNVFVTNNLFSQIQNTATQFNNVHGLDLEGNTFSSIGGYSTGVFFSGTNNFTARNNTFTNYVGTTIVQEDNLPEFIYDEYGNRALDYYNGPWGRGGSINYVRLLGSDNGGNAIVLAGCNGSAMAAVGNSSYETGFFTRQCTLNGTNAYSVCVSQGGDYYGCYDANGQQIGGSNPVNDLAQYDYNASYQVSGAAPDLRVAQTFQATSGIAALGISVVRLLMYSPNGQLQQPINVSIYSTNASGYPTTPLAGYSTQINPSQIQGWYGNSVNVVFDPFTAASLVQGSTYAIVVEASAADAGGLNVTYIYNATSDQFVNGSMFNSTSGSWTPMANYSDVAFSITTVNFSIPGQKSSITLPSPASVLFRFNSHSLLTDENFTNSWNAGATAAHLISGFGTSQGAASNWAVDNAMRMTHFPEAGIWYYKATRPLPEGVLGYYVAVNNSAALNASGNRSITSAYNVIENNSFYMNLGQSNSPYAALKAGKTLFRNNAFYSNNSNVRIEQGLDMRIENNYFNASGVEVYSQLPHSGGYITISNNSFANHWDTIVNLYNTYNTTVADNNFSDFGHENRSSTPIYVSYSEDVLVNHNRFTNPLWSSPTLNFQQCNRSYVSNNEFRNVSQALSISYSGNSTAAIHVSGNNFYNVSGNAISATNSSTDVRNNYFQSTNWTSIQLSACTGASVIVNNSFNGTLGNGLGADINGCDNALFENNTLNDLFNGGVRLTHGQNSTINNNTFANVSTAVSVWGGAQNTVVSNNHISLLNGSAGVAVGGNAGIPANTTVRNNYVYNFTWAALSVNNATSTTLRDNFVSNPSNDSNPSAFDVQTNAQDTAVFGLSALNVSVCGRIQNSNTLVINDSNCFTDVPVFLEITNTTVYAYNNTYNTSNPGVVNDAFGRLLVYFYLNARATNSVGSPIANATVAAYNFTGTQMFAVNTSVNGSIPFQVLLARDKNSAFDSLATPYTVNATKPGVGTDTTMVAIEQTLNANVTLMLTALNLEVWDQTSPGKFDGGHSKYMNDNVTLYANLTLDGVPAFGAGTNCNVTTENHSNASMSFNAPNGLYYFVENFSSVGGHNYSVSCVNNSIQMVGSGVAVIIPQTEYTLNSTCNWTKKVEVVDTPQGRNNVTIDTVTDRCSYYGLTGTVHINVTQTDLFHTNMSGANYSEHLEVAGLGSTVNLTLEIQNGFNCSGGTWTLLQNNTQYYVVTNFNWSDGETKCLRSNYSIDPAAPPANTKFNVVNSLNFTPIVYFNNSLTMHTPSGPLSPPSISCSTHDCGVSYNGSLGDNGPIGMQPDCAPGFPCNANQFNHQNVSAKIAADATYNFDKGGSCAALYANSPGSFDMTNKTVQAGSYLYCFPVFENGTPTIFTAIKVTSASDAYTSGCPGPGCALVAGVANLKMRTEAPLQFIRPAIDPYFDTNRHNVTVLVNTTAGTGAIDGANVSVINSVGVVVANGTANATGYANFTSILSDYYTFFAFGNNPFTYSRNASLLIAGPPSNENVTIQGYDDAAPQIQFVAPTPANGNLTNQNFTVNVTANDPNLQGMAIFFNGYPNATCNSSPCNFTVTVDGNFTIFAIANDTVGHVNQTANITIVRSNTPPTVIVASPLPGYVYNDTIWLNYTVISPALNTTWWNIGGSNYYVTGNTTIQDNFTADGFLHSFRLYANDSFGNENYTQVNAGNGFDNGTIPAITYLNTNASGNYTSPQTITFNATDARGNSNGTIAYVNIYVNGSLSPSSCTGWSNLNKTCNVTLSSQGFYSVFANAIDWVTVNPNNANSTINNYTLDWTPPQVIVTSPVNGSVHNNTVSLNYSVFDLTLNTTWYSLNNGANITIAANVTSLSSLLQGWNNVTVFANDSAGNQNNSGPVFFYFDNQSPQIDYRPGTNASGNYSGSQNVSFNIADAAGIAYTNTTVFVNGTPTTLCAGQYICSAILSAEGTYVVSATATDLGGNSNTTATRNYTIDFTPPLVFVYSPLNNTWYNSTGVYLNYSAIDAHLDKVGYSLDAGAPIPLNGNTTLAGLAQGMHNVIVFANDSANNTNNSGLTTFYVDTVFPNLTVTSPENNSYYAIASPMWLNYTATDTLPGQWNTVWYNLSNASTSVTNYSLLNGTQNITITPLAGTDTLVVGINDSAGNTNISTVVFYADVAAPLVNFNSTTPLPGFYNSTQFVNVTAVDDTKVNTTWIEINGTNRSFVGCGTSSCSTAYLLTEGRYNVTGWANDSIPNYNHTEPRNYTIDLTKPGIEFNYATNASGFYNSPQFVRFNSTDNFGLNYTTIYVNGVVGATYYLNGTTQSGGDAFVNLISELTFVINATTYDQAGNSNTSATRAYILDFTKPNVSISSPTNSTWYNASSMPLVCQAADANLNATWFRLDGVDNFTTGSCNATLNLSDGTHNVTAYANDSAGNVNNSALITFYVDTSFPSLVVILPQNNTYQNPSFELNYSSSDPNIDATWYYLTNNTGGFTTVVLANGANNVTVNAFNGTNWLTVYADDKASNTNSTQFQLFIDSQNPQVYFNSTTPQGGGYFNYTLAVNVTSTDDTKLNYTWLTINGTNSTPVPCSGAWCNITTVLVPDGVYNITGWANDTLGKTNSTEMRNFTIDKTAPIVAITAPYNNQWFSASPATLNFNVTDANYNDSLYIVNGTPRGPATNGTTVDLNLGDGAYNITVAAFDKALNSNGSSVLVWLDTNPPVITVDPTTSAQGFRNTSANFNVTATDLNLSQINITVNGIVVRNCSTSPCNFTINGDGIYAINATAYDTTGHSSPTATYNYIIDSAKPSIVNIVWPLNNSAYGSAPNLTIMAVDPYLNATWFNLNGTFNYTNGNISALSPLNQGWNNVTAYANDSAYNQNNSQTIYFFFDNQPPQIDFTPTTNQSGYYNSNQSVNFTAIDANLTSIKVYVNGALNRTCNGPATALSCNVTLVWNGNFSVYANATDNSGLYNVTAARNYTMDFIPPQIIVTSPANNTAYNAIVYLNYSIIEPYLNVTWYVLNSGAPVLLNGNTTLLPVQGFNNVTVFANDSAGNLNNSGLTAFFFDNQSPQVDFAANANASGYYNATVLANFTVSDANLSNLTIYVNSTAAKTCSGNATTYCNVTIAAPGSYNVSATAIDGSGNSNSTANRTYIIDLTPPQINVTSPTNNTWYNTSSITLLTYVIDAYLNQTWYVLDGAAPVYAGNASLTLPDGFHNVTVYANDLAGNSNNSGLVNFTVDAAPPQVQFDPTTSSAGFHNTSVVVNVTAFDMNLSSIVVYVNGAVNRTCTTSPCNVTLYPNGDYSVYGWANDSKNLSNQTAVISYTLDNVTPSLVLYSPVNNTYYNSPNVALNYNASDLHLDTVRYVLDGGAAVLLSGNITLAGLSQAPHTLFVYANDSAGNQNSSGLIQFTVDTTKPNIIVTSPLAGQTYQTPTVTLNYSVVDANFNRSWFQFNANPLNYTQGNVTLTLVAGTNTVVVFANDSAGNSNNTALISFYADWVPPQYFSVSSNNTAHNQNTLLSAYWTENLALSYAWLYTNNSGTFVNQSFNALAGVNAWTNLTILLNNSVGKQVQWGIYANDTAGNLNFTGLRNIVTTNTLPVLLGNPSLNNYTPAIGNNLTCTPGAYFDADGDVQQAVFFAWYNNSVPVAGNLTRINVSDYGAATNGNFTCSVIVFDGIANSTQYNSSNATIGASPDLTPPFPVTIFAPSNTQHNLAATFSVLWNDNSGVAFLNTFIFSTNNTGAWVNSSPTAFPGGSGYSNYSTTLTATNGATVQWRIYASDLNNNWNDSGVQTLTTANTAPVLTSNPTVTPTTAYKFDTLTCNAGTYLDANGDALAQSFWLWLKNGALAGATQTLSLESVGALVNDNFSCSQMVNDGYVNSTSYYNSTNRTISAQLVPPVVSGVSSGTPSTSGATITWTTDTAATTVVYYGTSAGNLSSNVTDSSNATSHSIAIGSLSSSTTYYYIAGSCDRYGNCANATQANFTTAASGGGPTPTPSPSGGNGGSTSIGRQGGQQPTTPTTPTGVTEITGEQRQEVLNWVSPSDLGFEGSIPADAHVEQVGDPVSETTTVTATGVGDALSQATDSAARNFLLQLQQSLDAGSDEPIAMTTTLTHYHIDAGQGHQADITLVTLSFTAMRDGQLIRIVQVVPKSVAQSVSEIVFKGAMPTILQNDPIFEWAFNAVKAGDEVNFSYVVKKALTAMDIQTMAVQKAAVAPTATPAARPTANPLGTAVPSIAAAGLVPPQDLAWLAIVVVIVAVAALLFATHKKKHRHRHKGL